MTLLAILRVALGHARRRWPLSLVAVLISAAAAGGVSLMIGDATERADRLIVSLQTTAARSVIVRAKDPSAGPLIPVQTALTLASLAGVERAMAVNATRTATLAGVTDNSVSVGFLGVEVLKGPEPTVLTGGRRPANVGEALASDDAALQLRLLTATGTTAVNHRVVPIVGTYRNVVGGAFAEYLDHSIIEQLPVDTQAFAGLLLIVKAPADIPAITSVISGLLGPEAVKYFTIEFDSRAADVERTVAEASRSNVRSIALLIIGMGSLVLVLISFLNALLQRRELARRRALGHSSKVVMATLTLEGGFLAALGAVAGVGAVGVLAAAARTPLHPGLMLSVAGLFTLLGTASAVPAGLFGALQDPARILRVP